MSNRFYRMGSIIRGKEEDQKGKIDELFIVMFGENI
jgi:hypothetical protein